MKRSMTPTTVRGEEARKASTKMAGELGAPRGVRIAYGRITKVHNEKALIKAVEVLDNSPAANGKWMVLAHSPREIAERWGEVKRGWIVSIQYTGADGSNALATIIKESGESISDAGLEENKMEQGLFRIFAPGIGIG